MHVWSGRCVCVELWPHVWDSGCMCGIVGACVG